MRLFFLLAYILLLLPLSIGAQVATIRPNPQVAKLPVRSVHRVFQDSEGFMWYGTVDGLCRDDGYNIQVFRSDYRHTQPLQSNLILCIAEDSLHRILFGTSAGAYYIDKTDCHVRPLCLQDIGQERISNIWVASGGAIFVSASRRHFILKASNSHTYKVQKVLAHSLDAFVETKAHAILGALGEHGICRFDTLRQQWKSPIPSSVSYSISDMVEAQGFLWMGTHHHGVMRLHLVSGNLQPVLSQSGPLDILSLSYAPGTQTLWATSSDDLHAFRLATEGTLQPLNLSKVLTGYTPQLKMLSEIRQDQHGNIWVAGYDRASFILDFQSHNTRRVSIPAIGQRFNRSTLIVSLCPDTEGQTCWLSQERVGLCLFRPSTGQLTAYSDIPSLRDANLRMVHELCPSATPHRVWAVPDHSCVYAVESDGMQMCLAETIRLPEGQMPKTAFEDLQGRLWIGTYHGIFLYNPHTCELKAIDSHIGHTTSFAQKADGTVFATVTGKGIAEMQDGKFRTLHPLDKDLLCITAAFDDTFYVGTGAGELLHIKTSPAFQMEDLSEAAGMNGDMVEKIAIDAYGHLWLLTNQRITEFDPVHKTSRIINSAPISQPDNAYTLPRFMPRAIALDTATGQVLLGGFGGYLQATPSHLIEGEAHRMPVHVTDVRVQGESVFFDSIADREHAWHSASSSQLRFLPDDQNIELYLSTLDHLHASTERYAYRLDDGVWAHLPVGSNIVHLYNLSRGTHRLQLRATDENGRWSDEVTEVSLYRQPAWWESTLAYIFYMAALLAALYLMVRYLIRRTRRKEEAIWSDSAELVAMHRYVEDNSTDAVSPESAVPFAEIDRMLMDKARKIVEEHISEVDFGVNALADQMNMSRSTLTRKIKSITRKTPLQFIRDVKMDIARQMLSNKTATVGDVALRLGYSDREYFAQTFRESFGVLPSEYLRQQVSPQEVMQTPTM